MIKGKMTGGGGSAAKADKREAKAAKKIDKLGAKVMKKTMKSSDPFATFDKATAKFKEKAQKVTDRYNKKK